MVERFTREDGKVAVLISPEYGAGWSTWVSEEDEEALLFDTQMVQAVLAGQDRTAASLAYTQTYHPRLKQSYSSALESNESSDSEMTMTTIIKNELDSRSAEVVSIDHAKAKVLDTEPIDCSNSVARSESATNAVEDDVSKIAAVSEIKTPVTMSSSDGKECLDFCTDDDNINPSYGNIFEYHVDHGHFDWAAATLIVEWLEPGEEFYVSEYNGYETLVRKSNYNPPWHVA